MTTIHALALIRFGFMVIERAMNLMRPDLFCRECYKMLRVRNYSVNLGGITLNACTIVLIDSVVLSYMDFCLRAFVSKPPEFHSELC